MLEACQHAVSEVPQEAAARSARRGRWSRSAPPSRARRRSPPATRHGSGQRSRSAAAGRPDPSRRPAAALRLRCPDPCRVAGGGRRRARDGGADRDHRPRRADRAAASWGTSLTACWHAGGMTDHAGGTGEPPPTTVPTGIPALEAAARTPRADMPELLVITGMSGAGRTKAAAVLEDMDWYVVDNLPGQLLTQLAGMLSTGPGGVHRLAAVVDVRGREFFADLVNVVDSLYEAGIAHRILFLDASDAVLVQRFETVRRPHPLQGDGRILDGIAEERALLQDIRERADMIIDTSDLTVHDLAREVRLTVSGPGEEALRDRFSTGGPMDYHAVGNLLIVALWELLGDPISGLDWVGKLLGARGRVLPMSSVPLEIEADILGAGDAEPHVVHGQSAVAVAPGLVRRVRLVPGDPPAPAEAIAAVEAADWVVLGPGSWFTSVMPHLLVPELAAALQRTRARRCVTLNLFPRAGRCSGMTTYQHLRALRDHAPDLRIDVVIADPSAVDDVDAMHELAEAMGASLLFRQVRVSDGTPRHDALRLAAAYRDAFEAVSYTHLRAH